MSKVSNSESFSLSLHLELVEASHWTLHKRAAQVWQAASEQTSDQSCCLITQHPLLWRSLSRASTASSQGKWEQEFVSRSPWMKWTLYKKKHLTISQCICSKAYDWPVWLSVSSAEADASILHRKWLMGLVLLREHRWGSMYMFTLS